MAMATATNTVLDAFRIKPFDLDALYSSWQNPPIFYGKPKEDPVAWLEAIKAGCKERNVPKDYWYRVGRHFMGPKPRERLDELGRVMQQMTGNKHVWNWRKFKIAVQNIGWSSPSPKSKTLNPPITERPMPKKQGSWFILGRADSSDKDKDKEKGKETEKGKGKNKSDSSEVVVAKTAPPMAATPNDTVAKAPAWLVNACGALEFLTVEHPKVMSAMSAILITVGSIPSIPAISAGAGGAFLASGAIQAAGAVAIGIGQCLKAVSDRGSQSQQQPAASIEPASSK